MKCKKTSEIFSTDLGKMPLATLAEWFQADNWEEPGSFMAAMLEEFGTSERTIDPWEDPEGAGLPKQVLGKLRYVKMRCPVLPQPMCPPSTRIEQTCHVHAEADKVIKETSTLSLDVPYGDSFYVVICDTYTATEDGGIKMVRTFGLDWVKSTMMKSMIESNVPDSLVKDAEKTSALMKKWVSGGGKLTAKGVISAAKKRIKKHIPKPKSMCNMPFNCCGNNATIADEEFVDIE